MSEPTFERVRVKGTDLIGTRAFFNSASRPYRTSEGPMDAVEVYFAETGEIRRFNDEMLEKLPDSE
ncbi:hypothetical protein LN996_04675 [Arthrobacter sp. AK01]|uniref:hypothetical protein n=1 Tax=Arthrobacter sp. AK01 TaxID=2894084 RepID=UPI001E642097|nr:hypothetical protein [Arthrobacter sp. AK01]MCD4850095.1 hypothetical protein [Arthrobacter sp. AK01]